MAPMAAARTTTGTGFTAVFVSFVLSYFICDRRSLFRNSRLPFSKKKSRMGLVDAIGNTPLIQINSLSEATGCEILGKCEFLNPGLGGSVKDELL